MDPLASLRSIEAESKITDSLFSSSSHRYYNSEPSKEIFGSTRIKSNSGNTEKSKLSSREYNNGCNSFNNQKDLYVNEQKLDKGNRKYLQNNLDTNFDKLYNKLKEQTLESQSRDVYLTNKNNIEKIPISNITKSFNPYRYTEERDKSIANNQAKILVRDAKALDTEIIELDTKIEKAITERDIMATKSTQLLLKLLLAAEQFSDVISNSRQDLERERKRTILEHRRIMKTLHSIESTVNQYLNDLPLVSSYTITSNKDERDQVDAVYVALKQITNLEQCETLRHTLKELCAYSKQ